MDFGLLLLISQKSETCYTQPKVNKDMQTRWYRYNYSKIILNYDHKSQCILTLNLAAY